MDWASALLLSTVLGLRHGLDPDHMAAITDMVGSNTRPQRGLKLGLMYALGHGLVVLLIGLLAIGAGRILPEGFIRFTEFLVGLSLIALGTIILRSLVVNRSDYKHKSRLEILLDLFNRRRSYVGRNVRAGLLGAMIIGIIHGLGAETPTQLVVIGHSSQMGSLLMSIGILLTFVVGLLMSTSAISFITSWGFLKARSVLLLNILMGALAGGYSLFLGAMIILNV